MVKYAGSKTLLSPCCQEMTGHKNGFSPRAPRTQRDKVEKKIYVFLAFFALFAREK
jgi:hypothetical protein